MLDTTQWTESSFPSGLRTQHRNILTYYYHHKKKNPHVPCFVPKAPCHHLDDHLKALEKLEELNLVKVIRDSDSYRGWIITSPTQKP